MVAIQPLQWFYSAAFTLMVYEGWCRLDLILEDFGHYSPDMWSFFGLAATISALFVLALTMPAELDLDFVHQYGYGYSSTKHAMSPEAYASYLSWLFFSWFNGTIKIGSRKTLSISDLPELLPQLRAKTVWSQFQVFTNSRPSTTLLNRVLWFHALSFFWQLTFVVLSTLLDFAVPYLLKLFLDYISNRRAPPKVAYLYIILIFIAQVLRSLCQSQMFYMGRKINVSLGSLLNAEIYAKTLTRRDMSGLVDRQKKDDSINDSNGKGKAANNGKDSKSDKTKDDGPASSGKVVNLMSTDTVRVAGVCNFWHIGVSSPIGIALGTYLLYDLIGWSSLVGMSILIISIPINKIVRRRYTKCQRELSSARDDRVTLMGELIAGIRMIKFFAWETSFSEKILKAREIELGKLINTYKTIIVFHFVWYFSPLLVTLCSFFCYVKIQKGELTPTVAFTAIVLFNRLKSPLNGLPAVYVALSNASVSLNRIAEYLDEPNIKDNFANSQELSSDSPQIGMRNLTAQWWTTETAKTQGTNAGEGNTPRTEDTDRFVMRNLNVTFPVGELSIVCGPTGSGKTSLLMAMLGEMDVLSAWLQNASIRDNILFGSKYEEERYNEVIEVCALKRDLEILDDADLTEIGEKGITLSGGQKQRVSLARAIYSRSRHVFLDDCLSAVDAHTAEHIYAKCLTGSIMKNRTCILVTHHVRLCIPTAKYVVLMSNGEIKVQGSVQRLREQGSLSLVLEEDEDQSTDSSDSDTMNENDLGSSSNIAKANPAVKKSSTSDVEPSQEPATQTKTARKLVQEETRAEGRVKWSIYMVYASAVGGFIFWATLMAMFGITRLIDVSGTLWVREWANSYAPSSLFRDTISNFFWVTGIPSSQLTTSPIYTDSQGFQTHSALHGPLPYVTNEPLLKIESDSVLAGKYSTDFYLFVYALISIASSLAQIGQAVIVYYGSLRAARLLYKKMLLTVVRAPLRFFDTTPVGRIMNRFSKDFETIDGTIASNCSRLMGLVTSVSAIIIVLVFITPVFVVIAAFISIAYLFVGARYINSSRELKRLHSVSRSPIFSMFGETLVGVATIRAFSEQGRFMNELLVKVDYSSRPFYNLWIANRWLSVRSDIIGAVVALSSGIFILMNPLEIDAGTAGMALTYALEFVTLINLLVREYTEIEMELNAIERVTEYTVMTQEPPAIIEGRRPPAAWPTEGSIEVKDLELKYAPELETVLRGVSFTVGPCQKVGVVGRFVEPVAGSIHVDGINICDIGLDDLRSRLTIIPQDPILFKGTIRSNLDPFGDREDAELWEALRRVHLIGSNQGSSATSVNEVEDSVNNPSASSSTAAVTATAGDANGNDKGHISFSSLDNPVSEGGSNFSQGQRQLLCMARALLRNSKIIVMDEATASVDFATDRAIQTAIQQEFENSTVICIAHRLNTIITYDKVLVLDHGRVLEYDTPTNLLDDSHGKKTHFREMCERSGELEVLLEMAGLKK
ncbi:hypothetical protein BGX31_006228 [Mortierella sp. GBA43]|nr:hypothetical protein BGX31_006228 [Mortierella sp. GBA43]